ncbi:hypothetical protein AAF712_002171 [Marasmius tenuissimus]|uniref:Large ribosomal subunit protein mL59 domain-containing protein n=1 Tax=Marasmius tenuissimus TaxID=585030 RepID=A0ABR3AAF0_9AGAR|nr:hypothetical protein PM082_005183 [Marasmius tenuissimus]
MSAIQAIKKFRLHELAGLAGHISRHGAIPALPEASASKGIRLPNPFLPHLNPKTGRWTPPKYSMRRQAELIKKAKETNSLHLLPPGLKLREPEALQAKSVVNAEAGTAGSSTAGVERQPNSELAEELKELAFEVDWVGKLPQKKEMSESARHVPLYAGKKRMFKGHKWERTKERKENHKAMLLRDMDKRVRKFKAYHRKKKPNPLKPAKRVTSKLPF